jgi:hypothetical protein
MPISSLSLVRSGIGCGLLLVRRVLPRDDEDDLDRFDRLFLEDDDFLGIVSSFCFSRLPSTSSENAPATPPPNTLRGPAPASLLASPETRRFQTRLFFSRPACAPCALVHEASRLPRRLLFPFLLLPPVLLPGPALDQLFGRPLLVGPSQRPLPYHPERGARKTIRSFLHLA